MTEEQWLAGTDLDWMCIWLDRSRSDGRCYGRKLRLFACACCRAIWDILPDAASKRAVETAERHADGLATWQECFAASNATVHIPETSVDREYWCRWGARWASYEPIREMRSAALNCHQTGDPRAAERNQVALLHDIIGNPFHPHPTPAFWPTVVIALAEALYGGDAGAAGPLHDALLEAGHPELAQHLMDASEAHPKGCWVVDLILGKE